MALIKCPECGKEVSDKAEVCIHCGYPLKEIEESNMIVLVNGRKVDLTDVYYYMNKGFKIEAIKKFRLISGLGLRESKDYVDSLYLKTDTTKVDKTIIQVNSNIIKCPKCGSTQIQVVPRRWSLMTGFLTNKVDRVCMNCKHKF